ncbi:MAG: YrzE family protein [Fimbriimonadaceae bacterium]|nr:MAG: YrzE family protein [Fimbriimonadaceae bacterium]
MSDQDQELQTPEEPTVTQAEYAKEAIASEGIPYIVGSVLILIVAGIMAYYTNLQNGSVIPVAYVLIVIALALGGYGAYRMTRITKVKEFNFECPFCQTKNVLTAKPMDDFRCVHCNREVPVVDGEVLAVYQVRCGFCNALNYYSDKSTGLICEECDRAIPIASDEGTHAKKVFENFTIHDDDQPYDLVLVSAPKSEEMIACLQQMLALNRNQVKDLLEDLPQTLLTGIPKKKATLLTTQISVHKGKAEASVSQ